MNIVCFTRDNFPVINMMNCLACARCDDRRTICTTKILINFMISVELPPYLNLGYKVVNIRTY